MSLRERVIQSLIDGCGYDKRESAPSPEAQRELAVEQINRMSPDELLEVVAEVYDEDMHEIRGMIRDLALASGFTVRSI